MQNEDVAWSPQYSLPATRTNKRRALSPQEVEYRTVDSWFFTLYWKRVPYDSCTSLIWVLYYNHVFLDWTGPSTEALSFKSPSKWNSYEGFNLEHCRPVFNIEAFNALQTWFGPSKYTSLKTTLQNATPNCKTKTSLEVLNIIYPPQEPTSVGRCHHEKWS